MAKITRTLLKVFGGSGASTNFGKFGSEAAGSGVKTKDIDTIQDLSAWDNGWQDAINSTTKAPYLEDMNSAFFLHSTFLAYLLQEGIPEWNTDTDYFIGSVVKKTSTSELYISLTDSNQGNALGTRIDTTYWKYLGSLDTLGGLKSASKRHNDTGQTIDPASSYTPISFDATPDYDIHSDFANATYFTVPINGYYQINAQVGYASTQSGKYYWIVIAKNDPDGGDHIRSQILSAGTSAITINISDILYLTAGDKIYCTTGHNSDTSKNLSATSPQQTFMSIALLY